MTSELLIILVISQSFVGINPDHMKWGVELVKMLIDSATSMKRFYKLDGCVRGRDVGLV